MGQDVGPYYAVIEALLSLDPSENRKSFLARAQKLWKEYEHNDVAHQELLAKASSIGRQQDAVRIRPFVCTSESVKRVPATDAGTVRMCDDTSGPSGCSGVPYLLSAKHVPLCHNISGLAGPVFAGQPIGRVTSLETFLPSVHLSCRLSAVHEVASLA